jgi:hypothetical protein
VDDFANISAGERHPPVDRNMPITIGAFAKRPKKAVGALIKDSYFVNELHRLTTGRSSAQWVAISIEAFVMRAAIAFASLGTVVGVLVAVVDRAWNKIGSHYSNLQCSVWSEPVAVVRHPAGSLILPVAAGNSKRKS